MLAESARVQKLLWTQPRATFEGRYYQLTDALCEPKPVQDPLPLWIGGSGERLTLRVVAESADGWNTFLMPVEAYRAKLEVLAEHCRAVGRDPAEIRKSLVLQAVVVDSAAEAEREMRAPRSQGREMLAGTAEQ